MKGLNRTLTILFSLTFTITGILIYWGTNLVSKTLTTAENTTGNTNCPLALFTLYSGSYDKDTKNLILILENKRSVDLKIDTVYLFYENNVMRTFQVNQILSGNELKSISLTGVDDGFQTGRIKTNCPELSVDFMYSELAKIKVPLELPLLREIKRLFGIKG